MTEQKNKCIFCKISKGDIPCNKVFEDKNFLVFLDIKPVSFGHLLIIPKKHVIWMQEADDKIIADIYKLAKKMMLALKKGLKCDYVQLSVVGNEVPHFHIHLIPRYKDDNFRNFPTKEYKELESKKILTKITKAIKI
ncbi:MAG: HIT family protein [Candidatus Paceibacterota bacterium]|jgi:histidine triad (HIT) family protein